MSRPFDFVDGKKLDLSLQEHRDIVIERNKLLATAVERGIDLDDVKIKVTVDVTLQCPVCGSNASGDESTDFDGYFEVEDFVPDVKCTCCKTEFKFSSHHQTYDVKLKPQIEE